MVRTCEEPLEGDTRQRGWCVQWPLYEDQCSMFGELKESQRKVRRKRKMDETDAINKGSILEAFLIFGFYARLLRNP